MTAVRPAPGTVWDGLVGQRHAIEALRTAAEGRGMSHSWLFTGPPGSGRSNAAVAFAAALQCENAGCGHCHDCHTGMHTSRRRHVFPTPESKRCAPPNGGCAPADASGRSVGVEYIRDARTCSVYKHARSADHDLARRARDDRRTTGQGAAEL